MKDLMTRIEAAECGSRELDCLIAANIGLHIDGCPLSIPAMLERFGIQSLVEMSEAYTSVLKTIPRYTSSLDAALTLVPEGWDWAVFRTNGGLTVHAWCGSRDDVFAETPALALCAAALKARST